jgi:hypothetical protein
MPAASAVIVSSRSRFLISGNYAPDIEKIDDELNRVARRFRRGSRMIRKSGHRFSLATNA